MQSRADEHPAATLLKTLYQNCSEGFINLRFLPSGKNLFISLEQLNSIPSILDIHKDKNAFFGVALRRDGDGSKQGVIEIPALWVDSDLEGLAEEKKEKIRRQYRESPLKPTLVVNSGGGLHSYWRLKEPILRDGIPLVEDCLKRLASRFHGDMSSTDASRILRIPGTFNYKYSPPREVIIKELNPEVEYNLDDFVQILPAVQLITDQEENSNFSEDKRQVIRTELNRIMQCEFLKHCDKDRTTLSEPEWYAMISVLARETEGPKLVHRLSTGYPRYSREETDKKILHAIDAAGPSTCKRIKSLWDCGKDCGVGSPVSLKFRINSDDEDQTNKHHFSLIQARDVLSSVEDDPDWVWMGVLPMGGLSLAVAKPKVGKTTFAFHLAIAVSRGDPFLGKKTKQGTVVYLALEEMKAEIRKSLSTVGVTNEPLHFHFGPAPIEAMKEVEPLVKETGAKLVIIDILQKFCRVKDLNDYAQVTITLEPLMNIARQLNCHILLTHHAGKQERSDGDEILGSTALLGGVDTSIHIKKRNKESRIVSTIQRYGEPLQETVVTLKSESGLEATGSKEEVEVEESLPLILEALEAGPLKEIDISGRVEKSKTVLSKSLRRLVERGKIKRIGKGKKGDPFVYEKNSSFLPLVSIEGGKEEFLSNNKPSQLLTNFSIKDSQKNEVVGGRIFNQEGDEFLTQKEGKIDPSKERAFHGVETDGNLEEALKREEIDEGE